MGSTAYWGFPFVCYSDPTSAVVEILDALSRPESTATLALLALVLARVVQAKR